MMAKNRVFLFLSLLILLFSVNSSAQKFPVSENLLEKAVLNRIQFEKEKSEAIKLAKLMNLPLKLENTDGVISELMRFDKGKPVYFITGNANGASVIKTSELYTDGGAGLHLSGAGITMGIWDEGRVRAEHQELTGRVTQIDGAPNNSNHATHVAGTMIAAGVQANARGMSFAANLHAHDWNFDTAEMADAAANGIGVSQHSYGYICGWHNGNFSGAGNAWHWFGDTIISGTEDYYFGFYGETAREWDELVYNAPYYIPVQSAGNDRGQGPAPGTLHYYWNGDGWSQSTTTRQRDGGTTGYDCISHRAIGKNILSVGAVSSSGVLANFSSWGPTDDGRVKPDVVAKGLSVFSSNATANDGYSLMGGTSMSGPMVSGSIGILMEHQENLHPGHRLLASTIKALVIHAADDMISGAPGPDYRFGWGMMNTRKSADIMTANASSDGAIILESTLTDGESISFDLVATGDEPLRATIVWTDVPGEILPPSLNPTDLALVNDLDIRLIDGNANEFFPYILDPASPSQVATTGDNFRDNIEMIHIESVNANEDFTLTISHKNNLVSGGQNFSLIISGANINACPSMATSPSNVMIIDSECSMSCLAEGGSFVAPENACPDGSTLQYKVDNEPWSYTLPEYNQNGPAQLIQTRCSCNEFTAYVSLPSIPVLTKPGYCNKVVNSADSGPGTLRHIITCVPEEGTVYYDQPFTFTTLLVNPLIIDKSITIEGLSAQDKPIITVDFTDMTTAGINISGATVRLKNVDINAINNSDNQQLIKVDGPAVMITEGSVVLTD